jgi:pimeloyl-ACP methyl ester carboxylesterase
LPSSRTEFVSVDGLRLRVVRHGEGRPLLLINGLGAPLEMWVPLLHHLGDHEVITFDMPGCGLSSTPRRPLGMRALAGIVEAMMHTIGRSRAHVLGYCLAASSPRSSLIVMPAASRGSSYARPRPASRACHRVRWRLG